MNRFMAFFCVSLLCFTCLLSSCSSVGEEAPKREDASASSAAAHPSSGGEASSAGQASSRPVTEKKEPVVMETPGGAVIVGVIKKDAGGWYLEPEQPLTVELTYILDHPEHFEALTRLEMYGAADDGIDKAPYDGEVVTVTGELQNYRGAGKLYLYPYKMERGKKAESSRGEPGLERPEEKPVAYDPSLPLPEAMNPKAENGHYVYNPYRLSTETLKLMGNAFADFYLDFVEAWMAYETSCPCPDKNYAELLNNVLFHEFPLFTADGEFNSLNGYDAGSGTISWSYTSADKGEHNRIIENFMSIANGFLKDVKPSQSDEEKAQTLYHGFCPIMTYDYEVLETRNMVEPYYAYSRRRGVCVTFAMAFGQLLTQVGIENTSVSGCTGDGEGHVWNLVTLGGKNYFCDTTYELSWKNGSAFKYFGMTMGDRLADGSGFKASEIYVGQYSSRPVGEITMAERTLTIKT